MTAAERIAQWESWLATVRREVPVEHATDSLLSQLYHEGAMTTAEAIRHVGRNKD